MIRNLKIGTRLLVLLCVQAVALIAVGTVSVAAIKFASDTTQTLNEAVARNSKLVALSENLRTELINPVYAVNVGSLTWPEGREALARARDDFEAGWEDFRRSLSPGELDFVDEVLTPHVAGVRESFGVLEPILDSQVRTRLSLFVANDLNHLVGPFLNALVASTSLQQLESEQASVAAGALASRYQYISFAAIGIGLLLSVALGVGIYWSISRPLAKITGTVQAVADGDFDARAEVTGADELGILGSAFDNMLNDRVATLSHAKDENEKLNNSVVGLLQAVFKLSQRDLTVKVPVTEDVTGPVADSLNLLTNETSTVLQGVVDISKDVASTSSEVKSKSDHVMALATKEQRDVETAATQLTAAHASMLRIAKLAQACNEAAGKAIDSTETAQETVLGTVNGITGIRDTIRETEKRIKRLGERSQEISGVVNLINSIAERTHILALNASMHAASAGEAGRGFAVVADEVQRLAENARNATSEIAGLVNNIQVETNDTVTTMNDAITKVVEGTQLAERAGSQMQGTQAATAELVAMVEQIAKHSRAQAVASKELRSRAQEIQKSSQATNLQLRGQTEDTNRLVEFSERLLEAVSVFTLPRADDDPGKRAPSDYQSTIAVFPDEQPVAVNG